MAQVITLLTDFGQKDPYVGVMKGVMSATAPGARPIDLTHEIPRQDVSVAAFWLDRAFGYFPAGSVHLAVVDPGVGTARRAIALSAFGHTFVCPDNGLISDVAGRIASREVEVNVVEIERDRFSDVAPEPRGNTFAGRDLFAPTAALAASGQPLSNLGRTISFDSLERLPLAPNPDQARVRIVDHYGNLLTDAPNEVQADHHLVSHGRKLRWVRTYAEAEPGEVVALEGSWGTVEIAVNQGSAAKTTSLKLGDSLKLVKNS